MRTGVPRSLAVRVEPYSSQWPYEYAEERERILLAGGGQIEGIEHVGSTSVPGMCAKPVIDVAVAISSLDFVEELVPGMASIGYDYPGDIGTPN
ncbi:MAG TPA: GrpB family protein, partial [Polyangiales bacterium]|nr:GrpB family protein [Polyangiales bacterium]